MEKISLERKALISDLHSIGFTGNPVIFYNLTPAELVETASRRSEGLFAYSGAFVVNTSPYTGRSPKDKYIVDYGDDEIWLGEGTQLMPEKTFNRLKTRMLGYLSKQTLFVRDIYAGAHPNFHVPIRIITDLAWHNLAVSSLFITKQDQYPYANPEFTVVVATGFEADPEFDGTRSKPFIILDFKQNIVLIGASKYAGEIKKSVFTIMNYIMPKRDVLSLHCSANQGDMGDVALFFGLSGTGKTTLSSDPNRFLIGDDEHGWCNEGIFNFEGGCYAKTIRLNPKLEPLVWDAVHRFQAILENVPLNKQREPDFESNSITENTRSAYPLHFIPNFVSQGYSGHPRHIFLLTADAFGVLPPLAKLSNEQALYYFISGYTSKLAGTERGLGQEPEATFSACFGAPFLPLHPGLYANMLGQRLETYHTQVWLLNTGWTGGGFGVGQRISLSDTRAMINAVLNNSLNDVPTINHPIFNLNIPERVEGIQSELLNPENGWEDKQAYQENAIILANRFKSNFQHYQDLLSDDVLNSGPR